MTFYSQRKSIQDGQVTFNQRTGNREEMLRQYFLYCASAATNEAGNEFDSVEFGTIEQGVLKREAFSHPVAEPEEQEE